MVGQVGVCARVCTLAPGPGLWTWHPAKPGGNWPRDEASRPLSGQLAWGRRPWPAGGKKSGSAITTGSMIWMLFEEARLLLDFEGALGVVLIMALDLGVFGEDCVAMIVISRENSGNE